MIRCMMDALSSCTEFKDYGRLTPDMLEWNNVLQFYRGRNEHEVAFVKDGRAALDTRWRGSYAGLCAVLRLVVHLCHSVRWRDACWARDTDIFGPWPVCPDSIVRRYWNA